MVRVLPSTRTCTRRANAAGTTRSAAMRAATRVQRRLDTNPPSARGSGFVAGGRSSYSGVPPAPPSRPCRPVALRHGSVSPHSGGGVPDSHRVPLPLAYRAGAYHWPRATPTRALAVGARCPVGGGDLRAVGGSGPRDRPRRLGRRPAEDRPRLRVRGLGAAALSRARPRAGSVSDRLRLRDHGRSAPGVRDGPPRVAVRRRDGRGRSGVRPAPAARGKAVRTIAAWLTARLSTTGSSTPCWSGWTPSAPSCSS